MIYAIAITLLLVAVIITGLPFFLQWLAQENILFTTVKEGTVKAIMRGKAFDHFIMAFAGYHLNDPRQKDGRHRTSYRTEDGEEVKMPDWDVVYHGQGNKRQFQEGVQQEDLHYDDRLLILRNLGLHWVGWPWANSVYVYAFEWNETFTNKKGEEKVLPRAEATDFIFVADFTYAIVTEGAETKDRLPINVLTLVTTAVRNPYRALFSGEDWMRRVTAAINSQRRAYIGNKDFQDLIQTKDEERTALSEPVIKLTNDLPDDKEDARPRGLRGRYGVEIRTADVQTIELSGDGKISHQEAATKAYVAKQEAEATVLNGRAKAEVVERIGDAEAIALSKRLEVIKRNGNEGMLLAQLDAMRDAGGAGARIIWANNPFISKGGN